MERTCTDCQQPKSLDEFAEQRAPEKRGEERTADGLNTYCRACAKKRQQRAHYLANKGVYRQKADQWRADNPEKRKQIARDWGRKQRWAVYGINEDDFARLIRECEGRCEICDVELQDSVGIAVDHDHATGVVRGILCGPCNRGIGILGDDPVRLDAAAAYLRRHAR